MRRNYWTAIPCAVLLASVLAGCAESILIRSLPPGATVTVNKKIIGTTPVVFSAPSKTLEHETFTYKVEAAGYRPAMGTLEMRVAPGRIVGYVFTAGILRAARGVKVFSEEPVEVILERAAAPATAPATDPIEQRLNQLESLRERGVISDEEYKRARGDVLRGVGQ